VSENEQDQSHGKRRQCADSVLDLLRLNGVEIVELQHGDIVYRIVRDEWELCKKAICRRIRNLTGEEI